MAEKQIKDGLNFFDRDNQFEVDACHLNKSMRGKSSSNDLNFGNVSDIFTEEIYWKNCLDYIYDPGIAVKLASLVLTLTTVGLRGLSRKARKIVEKKSSF